MFLVFSCLKNMIIMRMIVMIIMMIIMIVMIIIIIMIIMIMIVMIIMIDNNDNNEHEHNDDNDDHHVYHISKNNNRYYSDSMMLMSEMLRNLHDGSIPGKPCGEKMFSVFKQS